MYICNLQDAVLDPDELFKIVENEQAILGIRRLTPCIVEQFVRSLKEGLAFCQIADYPVQKIQIAVDGGNVLTWSGNDPLTSSLICYDGVICAGLMFGISIQWWQIRWDWWTAPKVRYARINFGPGIDLQERKRIRQKIAQFGYRYKHPFIYLSNFQSYI